MTEHQPSATLLGDGELTSISLLNPDLSDHKKRVVDGVVTITWPFSIIHKSVAFLLAERDFRLRRDKGQVRIRFHGASAKAIADASLGGGDEIRLSLDGVKWENNETQTQVAGSTLEWQLEFSGRLMMSFRRPGSEKDEIIDVDAPSTPAEESNGHLQVPSVTEEPTSNSDHEMPPPSSPVAVSPVKRTASTLEPQEFASPALLKRARMSYGSLFEGGLDIFDEDAGRKNKSRRKPRFSIPANSWRYTSRSPSPEMDQDAEIEQNGKPNDSGREAPGTPIDTPSRPTMVDGGCQTDDVDFTPMASAQVAAEPRTSCGFPYATPTPMPRTRPGDGIMAQPLQLQGNSTRDETILSQQDTGFLGHTPAQTTVVGPFSFTPAHPIPFQPVSDIFSTSRLEDASQATDHNIPRTEAYPMGYLNDNQISSTVIDSRLALAPNDSGMEPSDTVHFEAPFEAASTIYPELHATSSHSPSPWAAASSTGPLTAIPRDVSDNPMRIASSSPAQQQDPGEEGLFATQHDQGADGAAYTETASLATELEEPASEVEQYRDGGDEPGDDYDLRNYDVAHDDDDDVPSSEEEERDGNRNDVGAQIMDTADEVIDDEESTDPEAADYDENEYDERSDVEGQGYEGLGGDDAEGEYYSDEGSYDDEEEQEDEEESRRPPVSQQPVFISLLSDSEDEDEPESEPTSQAAGTAGSTTKAGQESGYDEGSNEDTGEESEGTDEESEPEAASRFKLEATTRESPPASPSASSLSKTSRPTEMETLSAQEEEVEEKEEEQEANDPSEAEVAAPASDMDVDNEPASVMAATAQVNDEPSEEPDSIMTDVHDSTDQRPKNASPQPVLEQKTQDDHDDDEEEGSSAEDDAQSVNEHARAAPASHKTSAHVTKEEEEEEEANDVEIYNDTHRAETLEPAETMDIDKAHDASMEDVGESTVTTHQETADVAAVVTEAPEASEASLDNTAVSPVIHKETIIEEAIVEEIVVKEVTARSRSTPDIEPPTAPEISPADMEEAADATSVAAEEITEASESQGLDHVETTDVTVQATATVELKVTPGPELEQDAEGNGAGNSEQPAPDGQDTAPPSLVLPAQTSQDDARQAPLSTHTAATTSKQEHGTHLPTPGDTQALAEVDEIEMVDSEPVAARDRSEDDDVDLEDQIMAEILQHTPQPQVKVTRRSNSVESSPTALRPRTGLAKALQETPVAVSRSSRTRRRDSVKSVDFSDFSPIDPSILLTRGSAGPTPKDRDTRGSNLRGSLRVTRSRVDQDDPSIQLARASAQAEEHRRASAQAEGSKGNGKKRATDDESVASTENNSPTTIRITRSKTSHDDPSIMLAKGSSPTPRALRNRTPEIRLETPKRGTRSASRSLQQQGDTPGASSLAVTSPVLVSPSVAGSTATAPGEDDVGALKRQLLKSLRTELPDYLTLKMLRHNLNKTTDILAVATATPGQLHRPKGGPRDYMLTLNLTDPSTAPSGVCVANIFRPHQASLPVVHAGDVVLLRRVNVVSMTGRGFGVRAGDASAWAVFEQADDEMLPQIRGPPVELTEEEIKLAQGLRRWWSLQDDKAADKIERASRKLTEAGKDDHK